MKKTDLSQFSKSVLTMIAMIIIAGSAALAQNVAVSDVSHTADASAVLDVYSTSKGFLAPRLTTSQRTSISSPATGLTVFDTDYSSYWYYDGSSWTELSYGNLWSRSGTDTYLSNAGDNVVIGTNTSAPGYKFYVHGTTSQMSRFDGQVEFWDMASGNLDADINDDGLGNGVINVYSSGYNTIQLSALGNSYFIGGNIGIGTSTPAALLHINDAGGTYNPQLELQNGTGGGFVSQSFNASGVAAYSQGVDMSDGSFMLRGTYSMNSGSQNDGFTLLKAHNNGIVDVNNQSRARAFQTAISYPMVNGGQLIPYGAWTAVEYDAKSFDTHNEFTAAGAGASSYFKATEEGFYQVNARLDYILWDVEQSEIIDNPAYPGYVSIAIFISQDGGQTWTMCAQGNKLQGSDNNGVGGWTRLQNNLAPNVSDVVHLNPDDLLEIRTFQSLWTFGLPLRLINQDDPSNIGHPDSQVYVSVHKSS